ncbi:hypothetical protein [Halorussus salilacus]|nr:hypothetical protein [Halorussus salilacus]
MPGENDTKSPDDLADATGADSAVVSKEYEAAAELAGLRDDSEE